MSAETITDAQVVDEPGTDMVPTQPPPALFRTDDPVEVIQKAGQVADALKGVLDRQGLLSSISGRSFVKVEGWTTLAAMLGVSAVCTHTEPVADGFAATVEARMPDGRVVGAATAWCTRKEKTWKTRDDYALLSMAQTRATSKALRLPLGFIVTLAGFEATPAEEMPAGAPAAEPPASAEGQQRLRTGLGLAYGLPKDDPAVMTALEKIRESACDGPLTVPVLNGVMRCLADLLAHRQEKEQAA